MYKPFITTDLFKLYKMRYIDHAPYEEQDKLRDKIIKETNLKIQYHNDNDIIVTANYKDHGNEYKYQMIELYYKGEICESYLQGTRASWGLRQLNS